jgi:hypothetical protein
MTVGRRSLIDFDGAHAERATVSNTHAIRSGCLNRVAMFLFIGPTILRILGQQDSAD